jgi:hypothetical protein
MSRRKGRRRRDPPPPEWSSPFCFRESGLSEVIRRRQRCRVTRHIGAAQHRRRPRRDRAGSRSLVPALSLIGRRCRIHGCTTSRPTIRVQRPSALRRGRGRGWRGSDEPYLRMSNGKSPRKLGRAGPIALAAGRCAMVWAATNLWWARRKTPKHGSRASWQVGRGCQRLDFLRAAPVPRRMIDQHPHRRPAAPAKGHT